MTQGLWTIALGMGVSAVLGMLATWLLVRSDRRKQGALHQHEVEEHHTDLAGHLVVGNRVGRCWVGITLGGSIQLYVVGNTAETWELAPDHLAAGTTSPEVRTYPAGTLEVRPGAGRDNLAIISEQEERKVLVLPLASTKEWLMQLPGEQIRSREELLLEELLGE